MFPKRILVRLATFVALLHATKADLTIYTDNALASGWEDWSWSSTINYAATDEFAGTSGSSISVNSSAYAALSVKLEGTFPGYAGLRFDIAVRVVFTRFLSSSSALTEFFVTGRATGPQYFHPVHWGQ